MTDEHRKTIAALVAAGDAANPTEDWAKDRDKLEVHLAGEPGAQRVWLTFDDGDAAIQVHGNLGLGIDEEALAIFFAQAANARPALKALVARVAELEAALGEIVAHHVAQNKIKFRDESRSTTLRIARKALENTG